MSRSIYIHPIVLVISVLVIGCQGGRNLPDYDMMPVSDSEPSARAYYYYTVAQLKRKQGDIDESVWLLRQAIEHHQDSAYLKLEMAGLLFIKKENRKALDLVQQVLADTPDNIEALILAGRIYQQQKDIPKAVEAYEKVLSSQPADQGIYLVLGRIYWNQNNFIDSERVFRRMTVNLPGSYAAYYFYGKALAAQGKAAMAEKALLRSIKLEPSLEEARHELLKIYRSQNEHQKIVQVYQSLLEIDPGNHQAAFGLAEEYQKTNRIAESLDILRDLGRRVDDDATIIPTLFERYLEVKNYTEASWMLIGMLKSAPRNSDLHYMAGIAFSGMQKDAQALSHMLKVAPDSRFYTNAVVHSAMLYHDSGKLKHAIDLMQQAVSHDPENIDYYLYLGSFYEELERFDEALQALQHGLEKDGSNGRLYFRIGVVYDKMGLKDQSIAAMKNVLRLTPNDAEALNYLGYTYADLGINLDEAETLIQTALSLKPNDGYITDSLGWVYFKRGNYGRALEWLTKAVNLIPDDPVILEHLGDVYLRLERKEKALIFYQRSLEKKKSSNDTKPLKEKIRTLTHP
jgi:tetratricopeptide (TPR) repeat protein